MLAQRICLLLLLSVCLHAEDPQVRVSPGLGGFSRQQRWFPVQVEVVGTGTDFLGVLSLETRGKDHSLNSTVLGIDVPPGARKRYELQHFAQGTGSTWLTLHDAGGSLVYEQELQEGHSSATWAVGILAPSAMGLEGFENKLQSPIDAVVLRAEEIPSQGWGLDAIDWLIWTEPDPQALLPQQVEAIRDWVLSGGRLILCVAKNSDLVAKSPLASIVPGKLSAPKEVRGLPALAKKFGGKEPVGAALVAQVSAEGEILVAQDELPLIVRSGMGLGEVTLVAFDPMQTAIVRWGQREKMWLDLMRLQAAKETETSNQSQTVAGWVPVESTAVTPSQGLVMRMESAPLGRVVNGALFIYLFAFYVLVVGIADYVFWKRKRTPLGVWCTTPLWIAAFSAVAWWIGAQGRRETDLLRSVAVYDRMEDGTQWSLRGAASLYVGSRQRQTIRPAMDRGVIWPEWGPEVGSGIPHESLTMTQSERGLAARDLKMYSASMLSFVYRGTGAVPELEGLHVTRSEGNLVAENQTGIEGLSGYLLYRGRAKAIPLGTFGPGAQLRFRLDESKGWERLEDPLSSAQVLLGLTASEESYEYYYRGYALTGDFGAEAPRYALSLLLDAFRNAAHWKGKPSDFVSEDPKAACLLLTGPNGPNGLDIDPSHGERTGVTVLRVWLRNK